MADESSWQPAEAPPWATTKESAWQPAEAPPWAAQKEIPAQKHSGLEDYQISIGGWKPSLIESGKALIESAKRTFTAPGEAYQGKLDPLSEEGLARAREMALLTTTLPGTKFVSPAAPAATPALTPETVAAAERLDVGIPRYMAGETGVAPRLAQGVKAIPWAGEPVSQSAKALRGELEEAATKIAPTVAPEAAGTSARQGISEYIKKGSQEPVGEAYRGVEPLLDVPSARVTLSNTAAEVAKINAERANANLPKSGAVSILEKALADEEGMDYAGIKKLRTFFGERTPQELIAEGIAPQEAKQLYGPLTRDLESSIHAAGGDEALEAWRQANTLARLSALQRRALSKVVGPKGDVPPEAVFSKLSAMAGSTSRADIARLQLAKNAMGPEAWQDFSAATIRRLGRDTQGQFSPDRFVTAYSQLAPAARAAMFDVKQTQALNDLLTVSNLVKDKISKFENYSKTGHTLGAAGLLYEVGQAVFHGGIYEPISLIGTMVGGRQIANYLARPVVARAAAQYGRAQLSGKPALIAARYEALQKLLGVPGEPDAKRARLRQRGGEVNAYSGERTRPELQKSAAYQGTGPYKSRQPARQKGNQSAPLPLTYNI